MDKIVAKTKILEHYKIGKELGSGEFGCIKKAKCAKTKKKVAIKIIQKKNLQKIRSNPEEKLMNEINIMRTCTHPHIITFIDFFMDDDNYYIVMEYVNGGDLLKLVTEGKRKINIQDIRIIFCQLISSIEYCHGNLICHRDIKLENILIKNKSSPFIKLTDFGLSTNIKLGSLHNTSCGSAEYAPPEIIIGKDYNPIKADIWSMGVVLYCMVTGCFPFAGENSRETYNYILEYDFDRQLIEDPLIMDLLNKIFVPPNERINMMNLKNHIWLKGYIISSHLSIKAPRNNNIKTIDLSIFKEMESLGFDAVDIFNALFKNIICAEYIIYHKILETKIIKTEEKSSFFKFGKRYFSKDNTKIDELFDNNNNNNNNNIEEKRCNLYNTKQYNNSADDLFRKN